MFYTPNQSLHTYEKTDHYLPPPDHIGSLRL